MPDKTADKKNQILQTALTLFSAKGAKATSMQEIAEACGISKGSLYLSFKSKEELEQEVYQYCFSVLDEKLTHVDKQKDLPPKERLRRQFAVMFDYVLELREFLFMESLDLLGSGKLPYKACGLQNHDRRLLELLQTRLPEIYGPGITSYVGDMTLLFTGMFGAYMRLLFFSQFPVMHRRIPGHLFHLLDLAADSYMNGAPEPLVPEEAISKAFQNKKFAFAKPRHPLVVIREMKQELQLSENETAADTQTYESLSILEEELMQGKPRRALIQGMLGNLQPLSEDPSLKELLEELEKLLVTAYPAAK